MLVKVIVDGAVIPVGSLKAAGEELAGAYGTAREVRVRVLPNFPASQQERDLTLPEHSLVVAAAASVLA